MILDLKNLSFPIQFLKWINGIPLSDWAEMFMRFVTKTKFTKNKFTNTTTIIHTDSFMISFNLMDEIVNCYQVLFIYYFSLFLI